METDKSNQKCSSSMQFKASMKPFLFLTLTTVFVLFALTSLKNLKPMNKRNNRIEEQPAYISPSYKPINDTITAKSLTPSASPVKVSDVDFKSTCEPEEMYTLSHSSLTNHISIVSTSEKVPCPRVLRPTKVELPFTALLSYPGSGNTWARHLLQQLTGIPTGSVYCDTSLQKNGFPYECRLDKVVAVKTHGYFYTTYPMSNFKREIMIVRNVYDSTLAEIRRRMHGDHTAPGFITNTSVSWRSALIEHATKWDKVMKEGLSFKGPKLIVFYEDLKSQLLVELTRIAHFLSNDYLDKFSFCCVLKEKEGAFHRKPSKQKADSLFAREDRILMNEYIEGVATFLASTYPDISQRILTYRKAI